MGAKAGANAASGAGASADNTNEVNMKSVTKSGCMILCLVDLEVAPVKSLIAVLLLQKES